MSYTGRTRLIRMERAEKRYEPPVWQTFKHPRLIQIELIRSIVPKGITVLLPDDRAN